jgi:hypothetical protein
VVEDLAAMTKWLGALFAFFSMLIPLTVAAGSAVTVESLKETIARELPTGSSKERVMSFIEEHHLGGDKDPERGYSSQTNAIYGIVRNVRRSFLGLRTDIQLIFYLDADGKLKNYTVEEVHTWF